MATDTFSPMYVGDTLPYWHPVFYDTTGAIVPLTTFASYKVWMNNLDSDAPAFLGIGDFFMLDGAAGLGEYRWNATDTAHAGTYALKVECYTGANYTGAKRTFAPRTHLVIKEW